MLDCAHETWHLEDFGLAALPRGGLLSWDRILRCADCGYLKEVEMTQETKDKISEAWRNDRCDPNLTGYHSMPHKGCILR
jgi:hypothetical protein